MRNVADDLAEAIEGALGLYCLSPDRESAAIVAQFAINRLLDTGWTSPASLKRIVEARMAKEVAKLTPPQMTPDLSNHSGGGGVYFLQTVGGGRHVKIGYTSDLAKRARAIVTGCPYPVKLIGSHAGPRTLERSLHNLFRKHRAIGEWFRPATEVLACARRLPNSVELAT